MKLPIDQRTFIVDRILTRGWSCSYWSRDEQMFACAEGWSLQVFGEGKYQDRIEVWHPPQKEGLLTWCDFAEHSDAIAYVVRRAEEGSPLHCRAMVLHMSSVIKYGN